MSVRHQVRISTIAHLSNDGSKSRASYVRMNFCRCVFFYNSPRLVHDVRPDPVQLTTMSQPDHGDDRSTLELNGLKQE